MESAVITTLITTSRRKIANRSEAAMEIALRQFWFMCDMKFNLLIFYHGKIAENFYHFHSCRMLRKEAQRHSHSCQ